MATDLKELPPDSSLAWRQNGSLNGLASFSDNEYDDDDDCEGDPDTDLNPFALGYRWVKQGRKTVQVPLTEENWIHPKQGDVRVNIQANQLAARYCWLGFTRQLIEQGRGVALCDQLLNWSLLNLDPPIDNLAPDLAVISSMPLDGFDNNAGDYKVLPETIPNLVVEILSKRTAKYDRGRKLGFYQQIGVEQYVLVDVRRKVYKPRFPRIESFLLQEVEPGRREYVQQPLNAQGQASLDCVRLRIGVEQGTEVHLYRLDGERVPGYEELITRLNETQGGMSELRIQLTRETQARIDAEAANAKLQAAMVQALALLGETSDSQEDRLSLLGAILKNAIASKPGGGENGTAKKTV